VERAADEPGTRHWRTRSLPIKLDSPLLFRDGDDVLLLARRQVAFGGRYDLGWNRLSPPRRTCAYQRDLLGRAQYRRPQYGRSPITVMRSITRRWGK
jgi:hypothetical protein